MPAIFHRSDNRLVEVLPKYPESLEMKGKYLIDYPDNFDLELSDYVIPANNATALSDIKAKISNEYSKRYPSYEVLTSNYFENELDYTNFFDDTASFPNTNNNEFLVPRYKTGDTPNTLSIHGRYPQVNILENSTISYNAAASGNRCIITEEIDITAGTSDGLGRSSFLIYFRSTLKNFIKDSSYLGNQYTSNKSGDLFYTNNQYKDTNRIRCFISADNGNSFDEVTSLSAFTYPNRKDRIRLAFVNFTDADLHLLSYTLMY